MQGSFQDSADVLTAKKRRDHGACQSRTAPRLFGKLMCELPQRDVDGLLPLRSFVGGLPDLADLDLRHYAENMILCLEIIEKSAFTDVCSLGNIFDCNVRQS